MDALALIVEAPQQLSLRPLALKALGDHDVVVEIRWSGVSSGTEGLLWSGRMPAFPGFGYPLVPGYESVGRVVDAGVAVRCRIGDWVFVPGSNGFCDARGLFGGAARRLVVPAARALPIDEDLAEQGVLLALAATAAHAIGHSPPPQLIIGHGVLGRLIARLTLALGAPSPVVWETNPLRRTGTQGYACIDPAVDERRNYAAVCDASGDTRVLDAVMPRLARGGELVLAGFYADRVSFAFPAAFRAEARLRIAAEWDPADLATVRTMVRDGLLDLGDLVSDMRPASEAVSAYPEAFDNPECLKLVFDWSGCA